MSSYLAYSYSACLTEKEQTEIDKKVKKSQEEFGRGFLRGTQISMLMYSLYLLRATAVHAEDAGIGKGQVEPPKGQVEPPKGRIAPPKGKVPPPADTGVVQPVPGNTPGFKRLSDGSKGAFVGGASAICGAALQSGDFYLGLACALLLVSY